MKILKNNAAPVVGVVTILTSIVLFFPIAFDNQRIYTIIIYTSIAILLLLLLFLIWVNVFAPDKHKNHYPD
ncbi:hypothetical protein SAMN05444285_14031 [Draconibacterium orientale]|jgi:protein-S-isoprenylcysteine O-methyltransferase Ste14|uniref:Uncharacterized protein n=1 Tax=Draconibacterium orientale TaxID=1168034 RepID=X5DJT5_9BACT|nr:hypothetical protein [Draconibacterium orientale]AHW61409.1 hypothetical protein FH5T_00145 [Draconibacterium orientale]SEU07514.1 hypothetical protein SAMN05444285_14031 [Draconibacterium orientale]